MVGRQRQSADHHAPGPQRRLSPCHRGAVRAPAAGKGSDTSFQPAGGGGRGAVSAPRPDAGRASALRQPGRFLAPALAQGGRSGPPGRRLLVLDWARVYPRPLCLGGGKAEAPSAPRDCLLAACAASRDHKIIFTRLNYQTIGWPLAEREEVPATPPTGSRPGRHGTRGGFPGPCPSRSPPCCRG